MPLSARISARRAREWFARVRITKEFGVATIPASAFYQSESNHQVVRFCFSKKEATLDAAAERLVGL